MTINKESLTWHGRTFDYNGVRYFNWTASGFEFVFTGTKAVCTIVSDPDKQKETERGWLGVFVTDMDSSSTESRNTPQTSVSGQRRGLLSRASSLLAAYESIESQFITPKNPIKYKKRVELKEKKGNYILFENEEVRTVKIHVFKMSEDAFGMAGFAGLELDGTLEPIPAQKKDLKLEFIGDSITCGYGIDGVWEKDTFTTNTERADKSYAYLTAKKLNAEYQMISWSGIGLISKYVDPSVDMPDDEWTMLRTWHYTDKSAAIRLGFEPEVWDASRYVPDIVIIHLGTNDMSFTRQKPDRVSTFINLYRALIESVHRRTPTAKICCCLGAMGQDLCPAIQKAVDLFKREFPAVQIKVVTFPMQDEKDGIAADWHPSAITHEKMANLLSDALRNF